MGHVITVTCRKCRYEHTFLIGIGFLYPQVYKKLVEEVKAGTFGEEWKKYLEEDPGAVINAEKDLYRCRKCGMLKTDYNMSVYRNVSGIPPENGYWFLPEDSVNRDYRFVKKLRHSCPDCSRSMVKVNVRKDKVPCPDCGEILEMDNGLWD